MKINLYWIIGIILILLFLTFLNSFLTIKSTQTSDDSNKFGLRLGDSKNLLEESNIIEDEPKEVSIGKFEDDNEQNGDKDDDSDEEDSDEEPPTPEPPPIEETEVITPTNNKIKLASFNAQIFGKSKWEKLGGDFYVELIEDYDIFILQEIREKNEDSYNSLCSLLQSQDYDCVISARAGGSSNKEQIAVFYKDNIDLESSEDIEDPNDIFEREPFKLIFDIEGYELIIWTTHIKPSDVENEMNELESLVEDEGNVIVIGDLNLDGSYDDGMKGDFEDWNYLIRDDEDTTVASSSNAYDRIILNDDSFEEYSNHGIDDSITSEESDHYLVWVEIEV